MAVEVRSCGPSSGASARGAGRGSRSGRSVGRVGLWWDEAAIVHEVVGVEARDCAVASRRSSTDPSEHSYIVRHHALLKIVVVGDIRRQDLRDARGWLCAEVEFI